MLSSTTCKSDQKNQYDPQVGEAAKAQAALAQQAQTWNQDFYDKHINPLLDSMAKASDQNTQEQQDLYTSNKADSDLQRQRYQTLGMPAEDAYYKMAKDYSSPDEEERQANLALGDQRQSEATQHGSLMRKFSGIGVDPTSPAALSAMSDQAVQNSAAEAAASTHARAAAKSLGMQLTSDAANFGRGGQSATLAFGNAASGNASAGSSGATNAASVAPGGAAPMNNGLGIAQRAYGSNLDAYSSMNNASMAQTGAASQGFGQAVGMIGAAALSDINLKTCITKLAALANGLGLYSYKYIWEPITAPMRMGYMAQEVQRVFPAAISKLHGYLAVDYSKVPV